MPWEDSWQSVSAAVFFLLLFINVEQNGLTWFCRLQLWDRSLLWSDWSYPALQQAMRDFFATNRIWKSVIVFLVTLGVAIFGNILFRGFLSVIPILVAVIAGYVAAFCLGILDFSQVAAASWFAPAKTSNLQSLIWEQFLWSFRILLVITSEHIGHQVVTGKIIGRDLLKDPGLHRSLFGDNFSTMLSGLIGSVPTTTYGENIGVMAVTKVYSVRVIAGAAVLSIICSFVGKLSMLIQTIPGTGHRRNLLPFGMEW